METEIERLRRGLKELIDALEVDNIVSVLTQTSYLYTAQDLSRAIDKAKKALEQK